ncbi:MAG TPA: hypothetical protein DCY55_01695 [Gammaproteobacteria bacterium]|jgi:hypothetical protein|nr:hypothetical protein [Gammaproteobacteria bacterium]
MKKNRTQSEDASISFLDVICCGFGAIVLLMMITRTMPPHSLEQAVPEEGRVADLQAALFEIRGETTVLNRDMTVKQEQLSEYLEKIAILTQQFNAMAAAMNDSGGEEDERSSELEKLLAARQSMTEEMERLLQDKEIQNKDLVGGIPVDSEYIVFIIDTSGSMQSAAWRKVIDEVVATLDVYPNVKGIQVLNDMGDYMFRQYRDRWIPDTPERRTAIVRSLRTWRPFSNSSPVEGIDAAIRSFYDENKKISLYVFGDDFTGGSVARVVTAVDRLNRERRDGERRVRIHAIGFPVYYMGQRAQPESSIRFAALMRELTWRNGGTFVGLNGL